MDTTFPTVDETTTGDYALLGCYTDDSKLGRTLSWPMDKVIDKTSMTTQKCLKACKNQGYPFAGTENGNECWCGVVLANDTSVVDTSQCNKPCSGAANEKCGGAAKLSVYVAKDLESLEPCGHQPPLSSSTTTTSTSSTTTSPSTSPTSTRTSTSTTAPTTSPTSTRTSTSSTTPPSTTTYPPTTRPTTTTYPPTTRPPTSTTPTTSLCVSTVTIPSQCEYGCGNWCSDDLPDWEDTNGCTNGHSHCKLQVADCFSNAGWPNAMNCFDFAGWCSDIKGYCGSVPKGGKCSKKDCYGKKPPKGGKPPTTTTTKVPCKPTSTSSARPSSSTTPPTCPMPEPTNVCKQPSSDKYGYGPGRPVGGIELPVVTCNDIKSDYSAGNVFKLYDNKDSSKCRSYKPPQCSNACADACKAQYDQCQATYAQGCKKNEDERKGGNKYWNWRRDATPRERSYFDYAADTSPAKRTYGWGWNDSWSTAASKCKTQYDDCLAENKNVSYKTKCTSYCTGW
jgi:hypothetical protein